jgi:hypothetical protein
MAKAMATAPPWFLVKGKKPSGEEVSVRLLLLALLEDQGQTNNRPQPREETKNKLVLSKIDFLLSDGKGLTICTPNEFVPSMFWDAFLSMPYVLFFRCSIFVVWCLNFFHTIFTYSYIPGPKGINFFFT